MRLSKILKYFELMGCYAVIYASDSQEDDEPLWAGFADDIPWYLTQCRLDKALIKEVDGQPISFRTSLGEKYGNRPGFVILLE